MELAAGADAELGEDFAQVVLDGAGLMNSRVLISGLEVLDRPNSAL